MPRAKSRTHFEQVPLEKIAKLRERELSAKKGLGQVSNIVETPSAKTRPYSVGAASDDFRR